jgi:D-glycero-alpha-D-manno-heptose-7-phosphate kinase
MDMRRGAVLARASCRADLAGGTLDLWPLYLFHPGAVTVNFALSIATTCRIEPRRGNTIWLRSVDTHTEERFAGLEELQRTRRVRHAIGAHLVRYFAPAGGFLLETRSESPAGAGISGSSALMIAATAALARYCGRELDREQMRITAQNVEAQIIKVPTGCQDYYPALYGGVNAIHLGAEGVRREALAASPQEINRRFVLAYTGVPRQSGINNWEVFKRHIDGEKKLRRNFSQIAAIAAAMRAALLEADWTEAGRLIREEWKLRRANYPGISTPLIDQLVAQGQRQGALAAKVCGAGGGGCVLFMVEPGTKPLVSNVIAQAGGQILPLELCMEGLRVNEEPGPR